MVIKPLSVFVVGFLVFFCLWNSHGKWSVNVSSFGMKMMYLFFPVEFWVTLTVKPHWGLHRAAFTWQENFGISVLEDFPLKASPSLH